MWNPIETIPYETGVIVTDTADGVFVGRVHEAEATGVFEGTAMEDGAPVELLAGELTGWRPAHQTADEMMAGLGYEKEEINDTHTRYRKKIAGMNNAIDFLRADGKFGAYAMLDNSITLISGEEILALAQLIKEEQK